MGDSVEVVTRFGDSIVGVAYVGAGRGYRIGTAAGDDLAAAAFAGFPIVADLVFQRRDGIEGELITGGTATPIDACRLAIPTDGHIRARIGQLTLSLRRMASPARQLPRGLAPDRRAFGYLAGSIALHALLWGVVASVPEEGFSVDVTTARFATIATEDVSVATKHGDSARQAETSPDHAPVGSGRPMAGLVGTAGSLTSAQPTGHIEIQHRTGEPQVARITKAQAIEAARAAGLLGSQALRDERFETVTGIADLSSGFDPADLHAPLFGGTGEAAGHFGLAYQGLDVSAGCVGTNCGTIGVGAIGAFSNGTHLGHGWGGDIPGADGMPHGFGYHRAHAAPLPAVILCGHGPCVIEGSLDKQIIRRYIKRQIQKVQYCYEKQLLAHPELAGTTIVDFFIDPSGTVTQATAKGFDDEVGSCLVDVVRAIEFPRSTGSTEVTYPFGFRSAGS